MLTEEIWRRCEEVFEAAVAVPEPGRAAYLDQVCGSEPELRRHVEALLRADARPSGLLDLPQPRRRQPPSRFKVGAVVAERFEIRRFIAAGGMGEVYEAFDLEVRETVAVKALFPHLVHDERQIERVRREVQLARRVTHVNTCRAYDLFRHEAGPKEPELYLVSMELLEGETLGDRLRECGRLPQAEARALFRQLAEGLAAVHDAGVVHRDLKSTNVVLVPRAAGERLVITDFGIARAALPGAGGGRLTSAHLILGTPAYLAPEQVLGHETTPRADIYAMGVVLYEMLTGEVPFEGETPMETAYARLQRPVRPPSEVVAGLDPQWDVVIERCLRRDPAERFAGPLEAFEALGADPTESAQSLPSEGLRARPAGARAQRTARLVWLATALGLAVALGAAWTLTDRPIASPPAGAPATAADEASASEALLRIAVLGFRPVAAFGDSAALGETLSHLLGRELALGGGLRVVPADLVSRTLAGLERPAAGELDSPRRDELVQLLGAAYLVTGTLAAVGDEPRLRLDVEVIAAPGFAEARPFAETGGEADIFEMVSRTASRLREAFGLQELDLGESHQARSLRPKTPEVARLHAAALDRLHHFDPQAAIELLERATQLQPDAAGLHSSLADAWAELGFAAKAAVAARRARDLGSHLPRDERLELEAKTLELSRQWDDACQIRLTLATFYAQDLEAGLRLVHCLVQAGRAADASRALDALRHRLPARLREDLRLDLAEARVAEAEGDAARQLAAAGRAAGAARRLGEGLAEAEALLVAASARYLRGELPETLSILDAIEPVLEAAGHAIRLGQVFNMRGNVAGDLGDHVAAERYFDRGTETYASAGYVRGMGLVALNRAIGLLARGELEAAEAGLDQAHAHFTRIEESDLLTRTESTRGYLAWLRGDHAASRRHHQQAYELSQRTGDRFEQAMALNNIATLVEVEGDLEGAARLYDQAAVLYKALGMSTEWSLASGNLAGLDQRLGRIQSAHHRYLNSLEYSRAQQLNDAVSRYASNLASISLLEGDTEAAERYAEEAHVAALAVDSVTLVAEARRLRGELHLVRGEMDLARREAEAAYQLIAGSKVAEATAGVAVTLAKIALVASDSAAALRWARETRGLLKADQVPDLTAQAWAIEASALLARGELEGALSAAAEARRISEQRGLLVGWILVGHLSQVEAEAGRTDRALADLQRASRDTRERGLHLLALEAEIKTAEIRLARDPTGAEAVQSLEAACQEARTRGLAGLAAASSTS